MYELDGIKTAMEEQDEWMDIARVLCPCEWWACWDGHGEYLERLHSIRFHYQFCPQARLPGDTAP